MAEIGQEPRTWFEILRATSEEEWSEPVFSDGELTDAPFDQNEIEPYEDDGEMHVGEVEYEFYVERRDREEAEEALRELIVQEAMGEPLEKWQSKKAICSKLRWQVFKRDKYRCKHCFTDEDLTVDHIIAESLGGPTIIENLQTLCRPCNSRKGAR